MARPKPPPHPIEDWLRREHSLGDLTVTQYAGIARSIDRDAQGDAEAWLERRIADREKGGETTPRRTVLVWRAAVGYYLKWKGSTWEGPQPSLRHRPEALREALDIEQLDTFYRVAEQEDEPYRTMLLLLPRTGLRSFEVCKIRDSDYDRQKRSLMVVGKFNVRREVALVAIARRLLDLYAAGVVRGYCAQCEEAERPCDHLFWTVPERTVAPRRVTTRDLRSVTERIARDNTLALSTLTPHVLRHTTATVLHNNGVSLEDIRDILGHADIRTLKPYLTADREKQRKALELMR